MQIRGFETIAHQVDFCVVGGGMAGLIAAITAARHGARVLLMQDRPVLGGNASSEVRMWICGARGADAKETGVLEEILLANYYRNRGRNYALWDSVLYEKARFQPGLELLLNCACQEVNSEGDPQSPCGAHIVSVKGWQSTTQTYHQVFAACFADCSGDSVLRISGAEFRWGRESRHEFGESHAPEEADECTMGNSLLLQTRETGTHQPFLPPSWARKFKEEDLPNRYLSATGENFWWLEVGGLGNTITQAEELRDELLEIGLGVWDLIKNHPDGRAKDWQLEWIGALPGKRENVRYVGDHILTQKDILAGGNFPDSVAFGGWTMDDHHPGGLFYHGPATIFHETPSPYGIPYRSLYSINIDNLFFAGRNISASHMAMSSTRVMGTCALCGQAVGMAAALAVQHACTPRDVGTHHLVELQAGLLDDDAYLPGFPRAIDPLTRSAQLTVLHGDGEALRSGVDRVIGACDNGWWAQPNDCAVYTFHSPRHLTRARLVFDSDQADTKRMPCWYPQGGTEVKMPAVLPRAYALEYLDPGGVWHTTHQADENAARLVIHPLDLETRAIRLVVRQAWGEEQAHIMAFEVS